MFSILHTASKYFYKLANRNIERLLKKVQEQLLQRNIVISSLIKIGEGDMGVAYLLPDDKVLKATTDSNELCAAKNLVNKKNKHLINIFEVIDFSYEPNWDSWEDGRFGIIIQEKIIPISGQEKDELDDALNLVIMSLPDEKSDFTYPFHRSWEAIEKMKPLLDQELSFKEGLSKLKNKFKFDEIIKELRQSGIKVDDWHSGNFGKKINGDYVLFDIGGPNVKVYQFQLASIVSYNIKDFKCKH